MEKIKHALFRSWYTLETLEDRIYHIILDVCVLISVISVAAGLAVGQPASAVLSSAMMLAYLIILQYVTMRYPKHAHTCRILLIWGMNLVLNPLHFFTSGGIHSGMITFYMNGLVLCAMLVYGARGILVYVCSLLVMEASIVLSVAFPQYVQPMTQIQHAGDMMITLLLASVTLYSIFSLIMAAYDRERTQNRQLMEKLRQLSERDALSGLYNRRELFRRLEALYGDRQGEDAGASARSGHCIAMFDLDDFKQLNDTYGHSFGDEVLVSVSGVLREMVREEAGEMTARYGGEEFVSMLRADSLEAAFARIEEARRRIAALRWETHPDVSVSISGGLIDCRDHPDLTRAMHDVDELLYRAKAAGKNRICRAGE